MAPWPARFSAAGPRAPSSCAIRPIVRSPHEESSHESLARRLHLLLARRPRPFAEPPHPPAPGARPRSSSPARPVPPSSSWGHQSENSARRQNQRTAIHETGRSSGRAVQVLQIPMARMGTRAPPSSGQAPRSSASREQGARAGRQGQWTSSASQGRTTHRAWLVRVAQTASTVTRSAAKLHQIAAPAAVDSFSQSIVGLVPFLSNGGGFGTSRRAARFLQHRPASRLALPEGHASRRQPGALRIGARPRRRFFCPAPRVVARQGKWRLRRRRQAAATAAAPPRRTLAGAPRDAPAARATSAAPASARRVRATLVVAAAAWGARARPRRKVGGPAHSRYHAHFPGSVVGRNAVDGRRFFLLSARAGRPAFRRRDDAPRAESHGRLRASIRCTSSAVHFGPLSRSGFFGLRHRTRDSRCGSIYVRKTYVLEVSAARSFDSDQPPQGKQFAPRLGGSPRRRRSRDRGGEEELGSAGVRRGPLRSCARKNQEPGVYTCLSARALDRGRLRDSAVRKLLPRRQPGDLDGDPTTDPVLEVTDSIGCRTRGSGVRQVGRTTESPISTFSVE